MKIFVTGATGYIGTALSNKLVHSGHEVVGLTHSATKAPLLSAKGIKPILGDLNKPETYAHDLESSDVVIHTAFENGPQGPSADRTALKTIGAALKSAKKRRLLIYTSGVWVLGRQTGAPANEKTPLNPPSIVTWRPEHENIALKFSEGQTTVAVVRPGCVYGDKNGLYGMMIQSAIEKRMIRLVGNGLNCWANVYLEDLAELYHLIVKKMPPSGIYHATDGGVEPTRDIAQAFLDAEGGGKLEFESLEDARKNLGPFADALSIDQRVSSEKAKTELGWKPRFNSVAQNARLLIDQWKKV